MGPKNPVVWFEIYVEDMQRAKAFYESVFNFEMTEIPTPPNHTMQMLAFPSDMESKNLASGTMVKMEGMKAGGNSTIVYFVSEDCSIEEARVTNAGEKYAVTKQASVNMVLWYWPMIQKGICLGYTL